MNEEVAHSMLVVMWFCAGAAVLTLLMLLRLGVRIGRIEKILHQADPRKDGASQAPSVAESSAGGAFETFLAEDPSRRGMPKKEQFAAYRKWRQENGLNWHAVEVDGAEEKGMAKKP